MIYNFLIRNVACAIHFQFIMSGLQINCENKIKNKKDVIKFLVIYIATFNFIKAVGSREYLLQNLFELIILLLCFRKSYNRVDNYLQDIASICCYEILYEIINLLSNVIGTALFCLCAADFKENYIVITLSLVVKGVFCYFLLKKGGYYFSTGKKTSSYICLYGLIVCVKIPFLYTDIKDALTAKVVFITIICCTLIFFVISKIEKHNAEQERARIEESNKLLSTKLHKSREILPAMVQVLSNVTENNGGEMDEQEAHKLLQEVNDLYGQQLKENNKEDLQLKSFCSTGLMILDQQLNIYQQEAIDKGVNFDIYVQAPINELLKRDDIDQLRLQRALGDLVRNAFRSLEREDKKCRAKGHILLIIGCRYEDILEISVVDNGVDFPLYVIEAFGKRGVTTSGTGNGLADLIDFTKEINASICLDEFDGRTNSFTKKISIIFDKKGINIFNSARRGCVTGSFWSTT